MPATIPSNTILLTAGTYSYVDTINLYVKTDNNPIASLPYNEKKLIGGDYANARFTNTGAIPQGLQWTSDSSGLTFFGTPQEGGTYEALFEGPYPQNWISPSTIGGTPTCSPTGQPASAGSILVRRFAVRFQVTVISGDIYSFGKVMRELLAGNNVGMVARRLGWIGTTPNRYIGARSQNSLFTASSVTDPAPISSVGDKAHSVYYNYSSGYSNASAGSASVRVATGSDLTADDYITDDWLFVTTPTYTSLPKETALDTGSASKVRINPETSEDYASYIGIKGDGVLNRVIFNSKVRFANGYYKGIKKSSITTKDYAFGEFFIEPSKKIKLVYYTTTNNEITPIPLARLTIYGEMNIRQGGVQYKKIRNNIAAPTSDVLADSTTAYTAGTYGYVYKATIECEHKYGYFSISLPNTNTSEVLAHLYIGIEE
jgi:hypothetical protein